MVAGNPQRYRTDKTIKISMYILWTILNRKDRQIRSFTELRFNFQDGAYKRFKFPVMGRPFLSTTALSHHQKQSNIALAFSLI